MKKKKIVIIALSLGLAFSGVGSIATGWASEIMSKKENIDYRPSKASNSSINTKARVVDVPVGEIPVNLESPDGKKPVELESPEGKQQQEKENGKVVYQGTRVYSKNESSTKKDFYNLEGEELESLLNQGYSLEDIFKADEIANRLYEDPKILLEKKKETKKDWKQTEEEVKNEKINGYLEEFKQSHPEAYMEVEKESFSNNEKFVLLSMYAKKLSPSLKELIDVYKREGQKGLKQIIKNKKFYGKVSTEIKNKHGLTDQEVAGLSDDTLNRMEKISNNYKVPLKDLIKKHKAGVEKMKEAKKP